MKSLLMLVSTHEAIMGALQANLEARLDLITVLKEHLELKVAEIEALGQILTNAKCNDYTSEPTKKRELQLISQGRGGWRGRSAEASMLTVPKPSDSAKALEQRVIEQGGKV